MHDCTGPGCPGCVKEAAKIIDDWGEEGVQSAAKIVGDNVAKGILQEYIARNTRQLYPGIEVSGAETKEELGRKIYNYKKSKLSPENQAAVEKAEQVLRRNGLID